MLAAMRRHLSETALLAALCLCPLALGVEPQVEAKPLEFGPRADEAFVQTYVLQWPAGVVPYLSYLYVPEELPGLDWGKWRLVASRTVVSEEVPGVEVEIEITPTAVGEFEIPAVPFGYVEDTEALAEATPSLVMSEPIPVSVAAGAVALPLPALVGGGAALSLLVGIGGWALIRRKHRQPQTDGRSLSELVQDALHAAQQHRLDGDFYSYYRELTRVAEWIAADDVKLLSNLRARTQAVGYGGARPTEDELNGDQRAIERAVARWKEQG